jgi:hypothetical protein
MTRYAKRVDVNQKAIVECFRKLGCWVGDLHGIGRGMPDLLVSIPPSHVLALVEVKDGSKPPSGRKLTEPEREFHDSCPAMIWIVESVEDVQTVVKFYRN